MIQRKSHTEKNRTLRKILNVHFILPTLFLLPRQQLDCFGKPWQIRGKAKSVHINYQVSERHNTAMKCDKQKVKFGKLGVLHLQSFKLIYTAIRMPINNFILDQSQQSNYGIKGQFLPKHLLSQTYDMAQKEKQGRSREERSTRTMVNNTLFCQSPIFQINTHAKNILLGDRFEFTVHSLAAFQAMYLLARDRTQITWEWSYPLELWNQLVSL